jgi:NADH-quinone oxidoreductase subunit E
MIDTQTIAFSPERLAEVQTLIKRYPEGKQKSAILPILHLAQKDFGWISVEVMDYVAGLLDIQHIEVYEVASFYTMFHLNPVGKSVLEVCRTGPCMLVGSDNIVKYLENKLNIKDGETTPDGLFTIKTVECLGACGYAPMMQVGEKYHEFLTEERIDQLLEEFSKNATQP